MPASPQVPSLLTAWSEDGLVSLNSGYQRIAADLPGHSLITPRLDTNAPLAHRLLARLLGRFTASTWSTLGSLQLELQLRHHLRSGFHGTIHYLWCDRDLAFIDLLPRRRRVQAQWVGTCHHPPEQLSQILRRPRSLHLLDAIILMSETQRPWFAAQGIPADHLHVIPHGVDTTHFHPLPDRAPAPPFTLLAVGNTGRDYPLLQRLVTACLPVSTLRFHIIAPAVYAPLFSALPNARFESQVSDQALRSAYQQADVLIHLTHSATANNVLVEALACGTPAIATATGGVPEYLTDGASGLLCPAGDLDALLRAIHTFAHQPDLRHHLRSGARRHAESLAWPHIARRTQEVYAHARAPRTA